MYRKKIIALMIMTCLAAGSFSQSLNKAKEAYDQGLQFSKDLNYAEAVKSYEQTIRICAKLGDDGQELQLKAEQKLPRSYFELAKGFFIAKNFMEAIPSFEKSLQYADQVGETTTADTSRTLLAAIYTILGNDDMSNDAFDLAIVKFNTALSYKSGYYKAYLGLGVVYMKQENLPFMKEAFDKVIAMAGNDAKTLGKAKDAATSAFQKAGAIALQANNFSAAVEHLTTSLEYNNTEPRTYFYLAVAYNDLLELDDAIAAADHALELQTGDKSDIYFELGKAYELKGNTAEACDYYKQVTAGINVAAAQYQAQEVLKCK